MLGAVKLGTNNSLAVLALRRTFRCGGEVVELSFMGNSIFMRGSFTVLGVSSELCGTSLLLPESSSKESSMLRADSDWCLFRVGTFGRACSSDMDRMLSALGEVKAGGCTVSAESFL